MLLRSTVAPTFYSHGPLFCRTTDYISPTNIVWLFWILLTIFKDVCCRVDFKHAYFSLYSRRWWKYLPGAALAHKSKSFICKSKNGNYKRHDRNLFKTGTEHWVHCISSAYRDSYMITTACATEIRGREQFEAMKFEGFNIMTQVPMSRNCWSC